MGSSQTLERKQFVSPIAARKAFVREVLTQAREHQGLTLLVDGLAGMGKTYLLRELTSAATEEGDWQVSFVRADEIERGEPYSFFERLVAGTSTADWFFLPDEHTSPVDVGREAIARLVSSGAEQRLIVIDDAQWIDAESQRVLRYLIPRVTKRGVLFAFGARSPHAPGSFGEYLSGLVSDSPFDIAHQITPLTMKDIKSLVLDRLGVGIASKTAQRILDVTGGSFLEVDSLLQSLSPADISQLHQSWDAPIQALQPESDRLLFQFNQLSGEARATAETVVLAGHELTRSELTAASRQLGDRVDLGEAVQAGVLFENEFGSTIMPRHALLAAAIAKTIPTERARAVHEALAGATSGYRSLMHTLQAAESWNPELRERVNTFVAEAADRGNLQMASEMLRAALAMSHEPDDRTELLESLALIHLRGKNSYLILDLLEEYETLSPSILHEFLTIVLSAHQVGQGLPQERVMQLLMSNPESADDKVVQAFFAFMVVILTMRSPDAANTPMLIGRAKQLFIQGPSDPSELSDSRLAWLVEQEAYLLVLDCYLMVRDQRAGDMEQVAAVLPELTRRIEALADGSLKVDAMVAVAGAHVAVGNLSQAYILAEQAVSILGTVSEPWASSTTRLLYADLLVLQGRYDEAIEVREQAEEIAYSSLDVETRSSWAAHRVITSAITGDLHTEAFAKQARRQAEFVWEGYGPDLGVLAECELARVKGDYETILRVTAEQHTDRFVDTRRGFLTYRALALIATGQLEVAAELITHLSTLRGVQWHEYWGSLDWLRALLADAHGDRETARWHFEAAIDATGTPLPLALTLTDFAEFLAREGDETARQEALRRAEMLLSDIGAEGYLPRVRGSLHALAPAGQIIRREQLMSGLTDREQQIVTHLAKGRSNNQIAESLLVSVATVRSHVSNVLRKLKLSSRGEVAQLLRDSAESGDQPER